MKEKWTEAQKKAIDEKGINLLVSASAGSGKTAVLVERIFKRIWEDEDLDIDRFLVVTFTNAAASEMREQIIDRINKALSGGEKTKHLKKQISLVPKAFIGTIHSFCLEVIRQHCLEIGLDPSFKVIEEEEAKMLKMEVAHALLEEMYACEDNENFLSLVEAFSNSRDDSGLVRNLIKVYDYSRSLPHPEAWLEEVQQFFSLYRQEPSRVPWFSWNRTWVKRRLEAGINDLYYAIKLCEGPGGPHTYLSRLESEHAFLKRALEAFEQGKDILLCLQDVVFDRLPPSKKTDKVDELVKEQVKKLRDGVKNNVKGIKEAIWSRPKEEIEEEMEKAKPLIFSLVSLVKEFALRFEQEKRQRGYLDFADLEHYCLHLFTDSTFDGREIKTSRVAEEWRARFVEVLVDECQDLNGVQEAIILSLASPDKGNLFLVGDVKQSIYRFRNADPMLFLRRYEKWKEPGQDGLSLELKENFRSRVGVIDGVNYLFKILMTKEVAEVEYDEKAALVAKAEYPQLESSFEGSDEIDFYIIVKNEDNSSPNRYTESEEESADSYEESSAKEEQDFFDTSVLEARLVIKCIRELLSKGYQVWDKEKGDYRPLTYRDLVILMRSVRGTAGIFAEEFQKAGIPCYAELATGYFEAPEVAVILSLLRIIDNPRQDIPLLSVLRSPLVGLSAEELAKIRICSFATNLYEAVNEAASRLNDGTAVKLHKFLSDLKKWREAARFCSVADLLWDILHKTGYYHLMGVLPGGMQRQANLRLLLTWAEKFEASSFRGLFSFLSFIDSFQGAGQDRGKARSLSENEDVVRIMSIHKSKGLEFPVVFLCGLGRKFNTQDLNDEVLCHKELGLGLKITDPRIGLYYTTLPREVIKEKLKEESLAEEMRLLYVALTRAREKLILVGTANDLVRLSESWVEKALMREINPPKWSWQMLQASSFLDWLGASLVLHPQGEPLRAAAGFEAAVKTREPEGRFLIHLVSPTNLVFSDEAEEQQKEKDMEESGYSRGSASELKSEVQRRLNWTYPYAWAAGKSPKQAVTSLVGGKESREYAQNEWEKTDFLLSLTGGRPSEAEGTKQSSLIRGTAYHKLLRHLDFKNSGEVVGVKEQIESLLNKEILTKEEAEAINPHYLVRLVKTPLGRRLASAKNLLREVPFNLLVPAYEVYPELGQDTQEVVMVQGVIDCLAEEEDGFLLVDYKTDQIDSKEAKSRAQEYKPQLEWYRRAAETLFKIKVKECQVYFTSCALGVSTDELLSND